MELAKNCSIGGSCFEMLYLDEEAKIRFARIPAQLGIMICETDSGFSAPMAFIRTIISKDKDDNVVRKVEFWNAYDGILTQTLSLFDNPISINKLSLKR